MAIGTYIGLNPSIGSSSGSGGGDDKQDQFTVVVEPTGNDPDDKDAIEAAVNEVDIAGGGIVQLVEGTYNMGSGLQLIDKNNVTIRGIGEGTVLMTTGAATGAISFEATVVFTSIAINNYTEGDTSIFTTVVANAGSVTAGDLILISGTESVLGAADKEFAIAAANGNGGTGEIQLEFPTQLTMTSATVDASNPNSFNRVESLRIETTGVNTRLLYAKNAYYPTFKNITCEGTSGTSETTSGAIEAALSSRARIENCRVLSFARGTGIFASECIGIQIFDNDCSAINTLNQANQAPIKITECVDGNLENDTVTASQGLAGIHMTGALSTRISVRGCLVRGMSEDGILTGARDSIIQETTIQNVGSDGITLTSGADRNTVADCTIVNCGATGIVMSVTSEEVSISDNFVTDCAGQGITIASQRGECEGNQVRNAGFVGILVAGTTAADDAAVLDNLVVDSGTDGINVVEGHNRAVIDSNRVLGSGRYGIFLDGGATSITDCVVSNNIVDGSTNNGIRVEGIEDCVITGNNSRNNSATNMLMTDSGVTTDNNIVSNNTFRDGGGTGFTDTSTGVNNQKSGNIV